MAAMTVVLKALANLNRQKVYQVICRAESRRRDGITVSQICRQTGMKQPAVSHHVAYLGAAGLVDRRRTRGWVYCTPSRIGLTALTQFLRDPKRFRLK